MLSFLLSLADMVLHIDKYLNQVIELTGLATYPILFLIVFCETGLVVTPFLPGDSLLFTTGALAAIGSLNIWALLILLSIAAILGDSVNYALGRRLGDHVYLKEKLFGLPVKRQHLDDAKAFYAKHGVKAIGLSRFLPILRTLVPFVAGVSNMPYRQFIVSNVVGGLIWVWSFTLGGYFFGNIPTVKQHFGYVVIGILVVSILPLVFELVRVKLKKQTGKP